MSPEIHISPSRDDQSKLIFAATEQSVIIKPAAVIFKHSVRHGSGRNQALECSFFQADNLPAEMFM